VSIRRSRVWSIGRCRCARGPNVHAELTWQATFRRDSIAYIPLMDANSLWLGARMHSARADHNTRVSCTVPAKGAAAAWSNCHRRATNKDLVIRARGGLNPQRPSSRPPSALGWATSDEWAHGWSTSTARAPRRQRRPRRPTHPHWACAPWSTCSLPIAGDCASSVPRW